MVFMIFLTTCSSTRFVYVFTEEYIKNEVAYFFDLDNEERMLLRRHVSEMVDWHRTYMLPDYSRYLIDLVDMLEVGHYDRAYISKALEDGRYLLEKTVNGLTPYASKFLINYQTFEDIEFMEKRMMKRAHDHLAKLSKPNNILYEKRLDRLISNFERFFGAISNEQVILLKKHARASLGDSLVRLQNRKLRQRVFIIFFRSQPNESELTNYLNTLLINGHVLVNPPYKDFSESTTDRFRDLLVNMIAISSESQREAIISKLREYAEEFNTISG